MKRPVLATKRQVMSAVINNFKGGRKSAASRLGYKLKNFDNHLYENAGSRPLSDEQIHQLEQEAGTAHLPEYIATMYGGIFVPLIKPETLDNIDLYHRSVTTCAKRGEVDQIIAKALEDDVIEPNEADAIHAAHNRYMSARHSEVLATIELHRRRPQS